VWGRGAVGREVVVKLGTATERGRCSDDGRWRVTLPALSAGGPYTLSVACGETTITKSDILVGDVWLCSGQSNMAWSVEQSANAKAEVAAARYPEIRFITISRTTADEPRNSASGRWVKCSPETIGSCSAAAYYFARDQWKRHQIPIGLIVAPVGGSTIQPWISRGVLSDPELAKIAEKHDLWPADIHERDERFLQRYRQWVKDHFRVNQDDQGVPKGWASAEFQDEAWTSLKMPDFIERQGITFNGVFWLRRSVDIPVDWAGRDLVLNLGRLDDGDETYFNGEKIGEVTLDHAIVPSLVDRSYVIPGRLVQSGRAIIAIRIADFSGSGGMNPENKQLDLKGEGNFEARIELKGNWKYSEEQAVAGFLPPVPVRDQETSQFFNGMIAPLAPYTLKGVLWYQGESNSGDPLAYRELFPMLIQDWRQQWGDASLPFLFVQLAGFDPRNLRALDDPNAHSYWVYLREAQAMALTIPSTEMATAIDLGDAKDIHPSNKQEVGRRLSFCADRVAHGLPVDCGGPRFASASFEGDRAVVKFTRADGGLRAEGVVMGFALAGEDRKFHWGRAELRGDTAEVTSSRVPHPVSIRYAWQDDPSSANLKAASGLPAEPFRTDCWNPY
jgi:sialate O-acetylesterase